MTADTRSAGAIRADGVAGAAPSLAPVVAFLANLMDRGCPGLVVGLSGTDSAVAFVAAALAMRERGGGRPLVGVHYASGPAATGERLSRILRGNPGYRTSERLLLPWLAGRFPEARVAVDHSRRGDPQRWADLFDRSLDGVDPRSTHGATQGMWVMGTRNRTEDALGTYSNLSAAASVQPLVRLWKSDVLAISKALGVPDAVVASSGQVDCDCGRFDLATAHVEEVDDVIRAGAGDLAAASRVAALAPDLRTRLTAFVDETRALASYRLGDVARARDLLADAPPRRRRRGRGHAGLGPSVRLRRREVRLGAEALRGACLGYSRRLAPRVRHGAPGRPRVLLPDVAPSRALVGRREPHGVGRLPAPDAAHRPARRRHGGPVRTGLLAPALRGARRA